MSHLIYYEYKRIDVYAVYVVDFNKCMFISAKTLRSYCACAPSFILKIIFPECRLKSRENR